MRGTLRKYRHAADKSQPCIDRGCGSFNKKRASKSLAVKGPVDATPAAPKKRKRAPTVLEKAASASGQNKLSGFVIYLRASPIANPCPWLNVEVG